jgi:hypothetical protein
MKLKSTILVAAVGFALGLRGEMQLDDNEKFLQRLRGLQVPETSSGEQNPTIDPEPEKASLLDRETVPEEDTITFFNGDVVNGNIISLVPDDGLRFYYAEAADEITFSLANMASVKFARIETDELDSPYRLTLVNGNVISGQTLTFSGDEFILKTNAAGTISIKRENVASIAMKDALSNLDFHYRVLPWNGKTVGVAAETKKDRVVLNRGEFLAGTVESIDDAQVKLATESGVVDILLTQVLRIQLKTEGWAQVDDIPGAYLLTLVNGDKLNLKIKKYDASGFVGENDVLGEVRVAKNSLSGLKHQVEPYR